MNSDIERDWRHVQETVEAFAKKHRTAAFGASKMGFIGTPCLKTRTKAEMRESIGKANRDYQSAGMTMLPEQPEKTGVRKLRKAVSRLVNAKYRCKPEWWKRTDVPFISPYKAVDGQVLRKEELVELVNSAKDYFARREEPLVRDKTPEAGTSGISHRLRSAIRQCKIRLPRQDVRARRNLFGNDDGGELPEVPVEEAKMQEVEERVSFETVPYVNIRKVGEGTFGEVFQVEEDLIIKVIPFDGDVLVNGEEQKRWREVEPEIEVAKALTKLRPGSTTSFCELRGFRIVYGSYPQVFLDQWDAYHIRKGSENDRPDFFPDDQQYVIFEFNNCGQDLESYQVKSVAQAKSIVLQVAYALSVAERALEFEHRDLHWGNVLCQETDEEVIHFDLEGRDLVVASHGVRVSIIDFTLSRITKDGATIFADLGLDKELFEGEGDLQFQVYRDMRAKLGNIWQRFEPATNIFWIVYIIEKLTVSKIYGRGKASLRDFRALKQAASSSSSAYEFVSKV